MERDRQGGGQSRPAHVDRILSSAGYRQPNNSHRAEVDPVISWIRTGRLPVSRPASSGMNSVGFGNPITFVNDAQRQITELVRFIEFRWRQPVWVRQPKPTPHQCSRTPTTMSLICRCPNRGPRTRMSMNRSCKPREARSSRLRDKHYAIHDMPSDSSAYCVLGVRLLLVGASGGGAGG